MPEGTKALEQHPLERHMEMQALRNSVDAKTRAFHLAVYVLSGGQLVLFAISLFTDPWLGQPFVGKWFSMIGLNFMGLFVITLPAAGACAEFAHFWFYRSSISVTKMTVVLAATMDVIAICWVVTAI